jgi:hypothetical protein
MDFKPRPNQLDFSRLYMGGFGAFLALLFNRVNFQPAPIYLSTKPSFLVRRQNALNLVRATTNTRQTATTLGNDYQNRRVYK